jgi:hypothetical protein
VVVGDELDDCDEFVHDLPPEASMYRMAAARKSNMLLVPRSLAPGMGARLVS